MTTRRRLFWFIATLMTALSCSSTATTHALLIGVSKHKEGCDPSSPMQESCIKNLEGPQYDIDAFATLLQTQGVNATHIHRLLNEKATRASILNELERLNARSQKDDKILIYYSGHGTSARDNAMGAVLALPDTSGAIIPYDATVKGDLKTIARSLIIGAFDLRPRLKAMDDSGKFVTVIFDACYSAGSVRSVNAPTRLSDRLISLPNLTMDDAVSDRKQRGVGVVGIEEKQFGSTVYPYQNLVYFAAAGMNETAKDIRTEDLFFYPTYDNKPHGAFTNALLLHLQQPQKADRNRDGKADLVELFNAARDYLREKGFPQTPQKLPSEGPAFTRLFQQPLLAESATSIVGKIDLNVTANSDVRLRINTTALSTAPLQVLQAIPDVVLTEQSYDLHVAQTGEQLTWYDTSSTPLTNTSLEAEVIQKRVRLEQWKKQLATRLTEDLPFTLTISLKGNGVGSTVRSTQKLGMTVWTERRARIAVISINAQGQTSLLYPLTDEEQQPIMATQSLTLFDNIDVTPPYGVEQVVLFAFDPDNKNNEGIRTLFNQSLIEFDSPQWSQLQQLIKQQRGQFARAVQVVYTAE